MSRLLCLGDLNLDVSITLEDELAIGSDTSGAVELHGGGSAANTAVWATRAGADVAFVGVVGDDDAADFLHDEMERHGVDVTTIRRRDTRTRAVAALVDVRGERSLVSDLATTLYLTPDDHDPAWMDGVGWLHLTGYSYIAPRGRAFFAQITARARELGLPYSIDPSAAHLLSTRCEWAEVRQAFRGAAVIFPNEDEAAYLAGSAARPEASLLELADCVVVTCGPDGVDVLRRGGRPAHLDAEQVDVVNTLGAGDAFSGGFLASRLRGEDDLDAARHGIATATTAIRQRPAR